MPLTARRCLDFNVGVNAGVLLWARRELRHRWTVLALLALLGRAVDRQLVHNIGAIVKTVLPVEVWIVAAASATVCLSVGVATATIAVHRRPGVELRTE